jgi:hypothetical protein
VTEKNGLFQAGYDVHHGKRVRFRNAGRDLMKMNGQERSSEVETGSRQENAQIKI